MRYVVTELEGFATRDAEGSLRSSALMGISCHVIDTLWNHRLVASYRTEEGIFPHGRATPNATKREVTRARAREHADRLNAAHLREAVSPHSETAA